MMQLPREQSQESKFQNWHELAVGISTTTHGMVDYLKDTMIHLHRSIKYGPCVGLKKCGDNCSKQKGDLSQWCPTCTQWRTQILIYHRYHPKEDKIQWSKVDSSEWPESVEEVIKIYGPAWWKGTPHYTSDLAVGVYLLQNCSSFNIPLQVCQEVNRVRQGHFARGRLQINKTEKDRALQTLIQLLESPDVTKTLSGINSLKLMIHFTKVPNIIVR